jgi:hypothetical protein
MNLPSGAIKIVPESLAIVLDYDEKCIHVWKNLMEKMSQKLESVLGPANWVPNWVKVEKVSEPNGLWKYMDRPQDESYLDMMLYWFWYDVEDKEESPD